jgi:hypothetical protein
MEWGDRYCTFKCSGTVNGVSTVSARLKLEQFNLADTNSELATCDERTIQMLRDQFISLKSQMNDTVASTT